MAHSPPDPVWDIWYTGGSAAQIFPAYRKIKSVWLALHEEKKLHTKLIYEGNSSVTDIFGIKYQSANPVFGKAASADHNSA